MLTKLTGKCGETDRFEDVLAERQTALEWILNTLDEIIWTGYKVGEDEVGGTCGTNGEKRNVYRLIIGQSEGKRPLGRPRCRWIVYIKMNLLQIGLRVVD
jgi:hypothetical protein